MTYFNLKSINVKGRKKNNKDNIEKIETINYIKLGNTFL